MQTIITCPVKINLTCTFIIYLGLVLAGLTNSGCSATRVPLPGATERVPNWKNLYYFHAGDSVWIVKPVPAAGNLFNGNVYDQQEIAKSRNVHIYAEPFSSVSIANGVLSVPLENIINVENHRISAGVIAGSIGLLGLLFMIPVFL